jgi:elongation factor 1-beta
MAKVIITIKVMPESPEVDLAKLNEDIELQIKDYGGEMMNIAEEPVGFGLVALLAKFKLSEDKGGTEPLEKQIAKIGGVNSVEVVGLDRTF